ncbi:uncharacterized protein M421DRAFT_427172 [Didymella exigua CBS 183.55]|uniref:RNase H type-1 domain-containing protein n=1 Tax=Didymella exigua CBS 183.55 TaxID=1150837 RepID=A0A6A5R2A1_9PLEO|nr:uncharacterized protein M421DRAFT_427172 [Didymella exigua CBS 183.55]KAF1922205.1 hypothetical protein M421DRAFT_427172 [Didymella exigua CBS 183.55]
MLQRLGDNLLAIYTDASSIKKGTGIGIGVTALDYKQQAKEIYSTKYNISKGQIVYNRELEGITRAFKFAASTAIAGQEI